MLFNPKWSETKADPFSLASLIAWLEKQPGERRYAYECNGACMLAQYFEANGFLRVSVGSDIFYHGEGSNRVRANLPRGWNDIAVGDLRPGDHTFGGALDRARKLAGVS